MVFEHDPQAKFPQGKIDPIELSNVVSVYLICGRHYSPCNLSSVSWAHDLLVISEGETVITLVNALLVLITITLYT